EYSSARSGRLSGRVLRRSPRLPRLWPRAGAQYEPEREYVRAVGDIGPKAAGVENGSQRSQDPRPLSFHPPEAAGAEDQMASWNRRDAGNLLLALAALALG